MHIDDEGYTHLDNGAKFKSESFSGMLPKPLKFLTSDSELLKNKDYQTVLELVKQLWESGVIHRGAGYCFSMADLVRIMLMQRGIPARITECKVTIMGNEPPTLVLIGHDGSMPKLDPPNPDAMDTHVVVITETEIPMIIDLSVNHIRQDIPYVVERANGEGDVIADVDFGTSRWTYHRKESVSVPSIHQQNILERIKTDKEVRKELKWLKIFVIIAISVALANGIRGAYDFYQVYLNQENYWGPAHMKQLVEKVQILEELVKKPVEERDDPPSTK